MAPSEMERFRQRVVRRVQFGFHQRYRKFMPPLLERRNVRSTASVLGSAPVAVSLTSYSTRVSSVHLTIESIGRGRTRPQRLILWLDDPAVFANLPEPLIRLRKRGLEIRLSDNFGPHTKYYPYVISADRDDLPLITVDDDIIYRKWWLSKLMRSVGKNPRDIVVYRGRRVKFTADGFVDYSKWPLCETTGSSQANFITGVSGAYYPVPALDALQAEGTAFQEITPKADDIWLSWVALRHGFSVRQVLKLSEHFPTVPGSQEIGLFLDNVDIGRNNDYLRATYSADDIDRLRGILRAEQG